MYKAAFFDIDGTLVGFKTHRVPESTKLAISQLRQAGIKCFISSGRHLDNIDNLEDLTFDGYVTVNGGMTYFNGELIDCNPIDKGDIVKTLDMIYPNGASTPYEGVEPFAVSFVLRDGLVMNTENEKTDQIFEQLKFKKRPRIIDLRSVKDEDIFQMISFFDTDAEKVILNHLSHCESQRWSPVFTDLVPKGQSKVRGMKRVCELIGAEPSEIMAFGDGGNDVAMLRFAGLGVAMGNAVDEVKAQANITCPSVDDDGILWAVERVLSSRL